MQNCLYKNAGLPIEWCLGILIVGKGKGGDWDEKNNKL